MILYAVFPEHRRPRGNLVIIADPATNSVLLKGPPAVVKDVRAIVPLLEK